MTNEEYVSFCYDALLQGTCNTPDSSILCLKGRRIPITKALYFSWHPNDASYRHGKIIFLDQNPKNLSYGNLALKKPKHADILYPKNEESQKIEESQQDIANRLRLIENLNIQTKNKLKQVDIIIANAQVNIIKWKEIITKKLHLDDYDQEYYDASIEALFRGRHFITKGRVFIRYNRRTFARTRALWNLGHPDNPVLMTEVIHHKDGNKMNDACDNLQKMSAGEHMKLHVLQRQKRTKTEIIKPSSKVLPICEQEPHINHRRVEVINKKEVTKRSLLVEMKQWNI
jgi:hypothetical protein